MRNNVLFTLLHDVWGESASESLRLVMMRLDEEMLCAADLDQLSQAVPELPKEKWQAWCEYYSPERASLREKLLADMHIQVLSYVDPAYPACLKEVYKPPSLLYIKGQFQPASLNIGMVGSRRATPYGKNVSYTLAKNLSAEASASSAAWRRGSTSTPTRARSKAQAHDRCAGLRHRQDLPA